MSVNRLGRDVSRRQFLTYSSAAVGGFALSTVLSPVNAIEKQTSTVLKSALAPSAETPIRVNFNENAFGMSPSAKVAAMEAVAKSNRYAKAEMIQLSRALAKHHHIDPASILLTAGASEGVRASIFAFGGSDVQFIVPEITYGDGEECAEFCNMLIKKIPLNADWRFDIASMRQAAEQFEGRSLVYLVNPNNPTSTITASSDIESWIRHASDNIMFLVDEAYAEFVNDSAFRSVDQLIKAGFSNVILLKTFSKIHGMAGLRVGYVLSSSENIRQIAPQVAKEKLNYCGVSAALVSLADKDYLAYVKKMTDESRQIIVETLDKLGIEVLPSETNFIFHESPIPLADFQALMAEHYIIIGRAFSPADNWCRLSLGTLDEMRYIVSVLLTLRDAGQI